MVHDVNPSSDSPTTPQTKTDLVKTPQSEAVPEIESISNYLSEKELELDHIKDAILAETPAKQPQAAALNYSETPAAKMVEDDHDRQLKQDILAKYDSYAAATPERTPAPNPAANLSLSQAKQEVLATASPVGGEPLSDIFDAETDSNVDDLKNSDDAVRAELKALEEEAFVAAAEEQEIKATLDEEMFRAAKAEEQNRAAVEKDGPKKQASGSKKQKMAREEAALKELTLVATSSEFPKSDQAQAAQAAAKELQNNSPGAEGVEAVYVSPDSKAFHGNEAVHAKIREAERRRAAAAQAKLKEEEEMRAAAACVAEAKNILQEQTNNDDYAFLPNNGAPVRTSKPKRVPSSYQPSSRLVSPTKASLLRTKAAQQKPMRASRISNKAKPLTTRSNGYTPPTTTTSHFMQSTASYTNHRKTKRVTPDTTSATSIKSEKAMDQKVEDARARARERVRQHKLKKQQEAGKENLGNRSLATRKRQARMSLTQARSPPLTTKSIYGNKSYSSSCQHAQAPLDRNPITSAASSPTHGYNPSKTRLPQRELTLTQPKPFHLSQSSYQTPKAKARPTMAESMDTLTRKGFREMPDTTPHVKRDGKLTRPVAPRLSEYTKRPLPKSSQELEEEQLAYQKTHQFRARPIMNGTTSSGAPPRVPRRRLTRPVPFHLNTDERAKHAKPPEPSRDKEEEDAEECKKQFRARSMPFATGPAVRPRLTRSARIQQSRVTKPRPSEEPKGFHARPLPKSTFVSPMPPRQTAYTSPRSSSPRTSSPDDDEMKNQFHARPLPTSTYANPSPDGCSSNTAILTMEEKRAAAEKRRRARHLEMMAKATAETPLRKKAEHMVTLHLSSEQRHQASLHQQEEERRQRELAESHQGGFKARPYRPSPPPTPSPRGRARVTQPKPFHLHTNERIKKELQQEEQPATSFKARPVPKTTFHPVKPSTPKSSSSHIIESTSPRLSSEVRAAELDAQEDRQCDAAL